MKFLKFLLSTIFIFSLFLQPVGSYPKYDYLFSGGPDGGTFNFFSKGISDFINTKLDFKVETEKSSGSVDNLKKINGRSADFGITYSGDLYLGRNGLLGGRSRQHRNVYAMAYLYGAPAHLIVLKESGIKSVSDLTGKKVAIGKVGSGASAAAERFFESMEVWDKMEPQFLGYSEGSEALIAKQVDALWVFAGFPNPSVTRAASLENIEILQVYKEAKENKNFLEKYPFYQKVIIPAGTYRGIDYDIESFQDSTLLIARKRIKPEVVKQVLETIYTEEGLEYLVSKKSTAKSMSIESGTTGIVTPLHQGAINFWLEKGKELTREQTSP